MVARVILPSGEVPTGILIALFGAPYFLYALFIRQKTRAEQLKFIKKGRPIISRSSFYSIYAFI